MNEEYKATTDGKDEFAIEFTNAERTQGTINGDAFDWDLVRLDNNSFHIIQNNKSYNVDIIKADLEAKTLSIRVNGNRYEVSVKDRFDLLLEKMGMDDLAADKVEDIKAPMPGLVLDIPVTAGQAVTKGQAVIVLEAMKMENVLKSPCDGTIKAIKVEKGKPVEKGQVLVVFE